MNDPLGSWRVEAGFDGRVAQRLKPVERRVAGVPQAPCCGNECPWCYGPCLSFNRPSGVVSTEILSRTRFNRLLKKSRPQGLPVIPWIGGHRGDLACADETSASVLQVQTPDI